jgi:hypothetical protein
MKGLAVQIEETVVVASQRGRANTLSRCCAAQELKPRRRVANGSLCAVRRERPTPGTVPKKLRPSNEVYRPWTDPRTQEFCEAGYREQENFRRELN